MVLNYRVLADVIDIQVDKPKANDIFLVDSNVWYWLAYSRSALGYQPPQPHQTTHYPNYIQSAKTNGSVLTWCGLSLAELAHIIEKTELEIFNQSSSISATPKEYRHNYPMERTRNVVPELQGSWAIVENIAAHIDTLAIDDVTTAAALSRFSSQQVDGYDLFLLEAMFKAQITQIITDDGDFVTVPGIQVFTCNRNVLRAANAQGRLVRR
jgi:predicted nucleic acid-binding protein